MYAISLATIKAGLDREQLLADARADKPDNGIVVIDSLHIDVESNPYLIMQTLRDKYDSKTPYAAINIWKKLLTIKWNRTKEKGSKHLQSVRGLFTQLDRLVADDRPKNGECFSETMKSIILLNTLPPSLNTDVKILTMQDKITTSQVEALIRKYDDIESSMAKSDKPNADKANAFSNAGHQKTKKQWKNKNKQSKNQNAGKQNQNNQSGSQSTVETAHDDDLMTLRELCVDQPDMVDTDTALSAQFTTEEGNRIILDSGATRHTVSQPGHFIDMEDLDNPITMLTATGQAVKVNKIGTVRISPSVRIGEVAVVPQARTNLMSVSRVTRAGFRVLFEGHQATVQTHTGKVKLVFKLEDGLYVRDITPNGTSNKLQTKRPVGSK